MLRRWLAGIFIAGLVAGCGSGSGTKQPEPDAGSMPDAGPHAAPTVTGVNPNMGPVDGGTAVTISGTGFLAGAKVRFGGVEAATASVVSATSITTTTPSNVVGAVTVSVINPDTRFGSLTSAFTYTSTTPLNSTIGWCNLQFPVDAGGAPDAPLTLYGRVYVMGVTDSAGQGANITMQAAIGTLDAGLTFVDATYNTDTDMMANDEYQSVTTFPAQLGTYVSVFRAQLNGGPWSYCEVDGIHAALDPAHLGQVIVAPPAAATVDWCNLQSPTAATASPGNALTFLGQVYKAGLTTEVGPAPGIVMEAGLAPVDGGFDWNPTTFDANVGNNDEFEWVTTAPAIGNYLTAFRAQFDGGPWTYCETDGPHATLDPTLAGTLTVAAPVTAIGWCNLQFPTQASGTPNAPLTLYSRVYVQGITDQPGQQGPGINVEIAVGDPDGGLVFGSGAFDANTDNGANDEFQVNTTFPPAVGLYASVARAQINGGPWTYCGVDGPHTSADPAQYGTVTVVAPSPLTVDWCNLQFPTQATNNPGDPLTFYGEVFKAGLTEPTGQGAGIVMQAGLSNDGGMTWTDATYDVDVGDNDEYEWVTTAPALGQYATAFRAALDGGPWTYCEVDGPHPSFVLQEAGTLTVVAPAASVVTWCDLQFPQTATGAPGAAFTLLGQVYQPGITDAVGPGAGIVMQAGIESLDGGWAWSNAAYQSDQGNNDQYEWDTSDPTTPGAYGTAFRASLDGGPWTYCEINGPSSALDQTHLGSLDVVVSAPPQVQWCNLQFPTAVISAPDSPLTLYGQVYIAGVTNQPGQAPGIAMQAGVSGEDGGWSWLAATFDADQGNNDEYETQVTTPGDPGAYATAFRASLDGGPWSYCEVDGLHAQLDPASAGTLTVQAAVVGPVQWCNLQYPLQVTVDAGSQVAFYGRVYQPGVTDQSGNTGAGVYLEFGVSTADAGWSWNPSTFNVNVDGTTPGDHANDEFQYLETAPAVGNYATAYRAALDGGPWTFCEVDGPHQSLDSSETGQLTVVAPPPPPTVQWCNLQFPTQASGNAGDALTLYGQVYQPGLTNQPGPAPGIVMQAGLGSTDGGWSWNATVFNVNVGNNDEFEWQTTDPASGSYLTAFRAQLDGGPWLYCETDGPHANLDPAQAGTLTVQ